MMNEQNAPAKLEDMQKFAEYLSRNPKEAIKFFQSAGILDQNGNLSEHYREKKMETEWVLVECVNQFRIRYMVEVPKGKAEYALDTVTCEDAKEFSQQHLGETIVSHRVVSKNEALTMCDADNDYGAGWETDKKIEVFFTSIKDQSVYNV